MEAIVIWRHFFQTGIPWFLSTCSFTMASTAGKKACVQELVHFSKPHAIKSFLRSYCYERVALELCCIPFVKAALVLVPEF
jgi:hypothetical protein